MSPIKARLLQVFLRNGQAEFDPLPSLTSTPSGGDMAFADVNLDGVIDFLTCGSAISLTPAPYLPCDGIRNRGLAFVGGVLRRKRC